MTRAWYAGRVVTLANLWPLYAIGALAATATARTVLPLAAVLVPVGLAALLAWRDRWLLRRGTPTIDDLRLAAGRHRLLAVLGAAASVFVAIGLVATIGLPSRAWYLLPALVAAPVALWGYARRLTALASAGTVPSRGAA